MAPNFIVEAPLAVDDQEATLVARRLDGPNQALYVGEMKTENGELGPNAEGLRQSLLRLAGLMQKERKHRGRHRAFTQYQFVQMAYDPCDGRGDKLDRFF